MSLIHISMCIRDRVKGVKLIKMELGEPDASGRRSPVEIAGSEYEMECDTVIMSLPELSLIHI